MTEYDVLGIYWWTEKDGERHYRCRGIGPKYKRFYQWVYMTSYKCTSVDMPWDFFIFEDPNDHDRLIATFPDDVWEDRMEDGDD